MFRSPITDTQTKPTTVPAPIGGLNAKDSLAAMPPTDAFVMRNWWPQPYGVAVRNGYTFWNSVGTVGAVHTLAPYLATDGTSKLFAFAGAFIYDVTVKGTATGVPGFTTNTTDIWQYIQMSNTAGNHLIAVNGQDDAFLYNSTGAHKLVVGDGIVAYTWAGLDPKKAIQLTTHQSRLWAVEKNTSFGWFLPPDAIQGTFVKFDFGPLFAHGGYLKFLSTWTLDDGNGAEDHLVAVSSAGDAVVFAGTDPADDATWAMVGVYYIGAPPAGRRAYTKLGGDLAILTQQGAVSMVATLSSTKVNESASKLLSEKIQFLISELISNYATLEGWTLNYFPRVNMLLINVPSVVAGGNIQLASNQITEAWTQFTEVDATCWVNYNSDPYFADYEGNIWKFWDGHQDAVDLAGQGTSILTDVQQAYNYFGGLAVQKQVGMYRPNFIVGRPVKYASMILYDFNTDDLPAPGVLPPLSESIWGGSLWGSAKWGGGSYTQRPWVQAAGLGVAGSLRMTMQSEGSVLWVSTDYSVIGGLGLL